MALAVLLACATRPPPAQPPLPPMPTPPAAAATGPSDGCAADGDCVVTNFAGCCACPQCSVGRPRALTRAALARETDACARVECDMRPCDLGGMCPPGEDASHLAARCIAGACSLERR